MGSTTTQAAMTPRQRWLALFSRQTPDRVPTDFWCTPEVYGRLVKDLGCRDEEALWQQLHIDRPRFFGPTPLRRNHPDDPQAGIWGTKGVKIDYGSGSYGETTFHPLAHMTTAAEIHRFRWPSPDDYDYQVITAALEKDDDFRLRNAGVYEPFLLYCSMRSMEKAFEDLALDPDIAEAGLGHIFDFHHEHLRRVFEAGKGKIDFMYLAEDLGAQTGPLMSLDMYRRFLLPNQKKMADLARSFGIKIFYHTDGAAYQFLPDLIDVVGIDILNPIQWRCPGMERQRLVKDFGHRIIFHGAVDNQHTLPFGSPADVRQEVRENLDIFRVRHGGRYICAPCHNLQPVTPTANIVAMYETLQEFGSLK
ncbi:MAG: hypothetical protein IT443_00225 [Phycisphaeraceae bacterium]|nr:hypothetical protein [Phycisphaeraceae bacterium]